MRLASTVVAIVRKEVSRRKNILSITKAVKSKLMTDESFAKIEFLSAVQTQWEYKKKSVLWSILSNSSVSRTMSCLLYLILPVSGRSDLFMISLPGGRFQMLKFCSVNKDKVSSQNFFSVFVRRLRNCATSYEVSRSVAISVQRWLARLGWA